MDESGESLVTDFADKGPLQGLPDVSQRSAAPNTILSTLPLFPVLDAFREYESHLTPESGTPFRY